MTELEKQIAELREKINEARRQGRPIDEMTLQLAELNEKHFHEVGVYLPPFKARLGAQCGGRRR
ncbi:MAG TPA: hypothetical protein PKY31_04115 [Spirochaetota bacterium]|nr:hypothetical protein [Spirochaetota bacterium]